MNMKFEGRNLEECLGLAEKKLAIGRENFRYEILGEEKSFLKKKCVIAVYSDSKDEEQNTQQEKNMVKKTEVGVLLQDNRIILEGDSSETFILEFPEEVHIFIKGEEVKSPQEVTSLDEITYKCDKRNASRELNIEILDNSMKATATIKYHKEELIKIKCDFYDRKIKVSCIDEKGEDAPIYTKEEIEKILKDKKIQFGIIDESIEKICSSRDINALVIAEGIPVINDEDDIIDIKFENSKRTVSVDSLKAIDYRNLYSIANIEKGEVLAELIVGKEGTSGKNIYGVEIKKTKKKTLVLKAGEGCTVEGNTVVATTDGRPNVKNGLFSVNKLFEVAKDVDLKSGNVKFIGDVKVNGSVREGMEVYSGNSIHVNDNVETARLIAQGEIHIGGNTLNSTIIAGAKDVSVKNYIDILTSLKADLELLCKLTEELKMQKPMLDNHDGKIIKLFMETKVKTLAKDAVKILIQNSISDEYGIRIKEIIREKIIGNGPLTIKSSNELYELIKCIENELEKKQEEINIPVDVYLSYCQDTTVQASGNIYFTGKGEYVSSIQAKGNIEFLQEDSIVRGGTIIAGNSIKVKSVGSVAGVLTELKVGRTGVIEADVAYQNTVFFFGERQYHLEVASKNVKAYLDQVGDIVVDKFIL